MGDEKPKVNFIWSMSNVPDLNNEIHSGIRFKNDRYMFLVDSENFYKIDIQTNETRTFAGITISVNKFRLIMYWTIFLRS